MHGVNLDLLRLSPVQHPDGRATDPHAHHRAEHLMALRAARRARWQAALSRAMALVGRKGPLRAVRARSA